MRKVSHEIHNGMNIIDSRNVIARIEELEGIFANSEISEANGATPQLDENGKVREETATCGECGKSWNDALISSNTPAPSGRCPYEDIHEELAELKQLQVLADEASGSPDWKYGEALIQDSYFQEYAQQLAEDCGMIQKSDQWPNRCIDWEQAAEELKQDYMSVEFGDETYWIRA